MATDLENEVNRAIGQEQYLQEQIDTKQDKGDYALNSRVDGVVDVFDKEIDTISTEIEELITTKADKSNTYTKDEVDIKLQNVKVDAYTKVETNNLLSQKANQSALDITNNNLDALTGEIENIAGELDSKADKSEIPTKVSELENDSDFTTETEVAQMIASIPQFEVKITQELPQTGQAMVLYLVPKDGEAPDVYLEYIWLATTQSFELIGSTTVDLTGYVKNTDYATSSIGGVIKTNTFYSTYTSNGFIQAHKKSLEDYMSATGMSNNAFISKGTLENIKESLVTSVGDTKYQVIGDYATNTRVDEVENNKTQVIIRSW